MRTSIKFVNPPKEGKKFGTVVTANDERYAYSPAAVQPIKGDCDIEFKEEKWGDNNVKVLKSLRPVANQNVSSNGNGEKWYMPFVSNIVAHAIEAQLITSPDDIDKWSKSAYQAAITINKPAASTMTDITNMEDDIPY